LFAEHATCDERSELLKLASRVDHVIRQPDGNWRACGDSRKLMKVLVTGDLVTVALAMRAHLKPDWRFHCQVSGIGPTSRNFPGLILADFEVARLKRGASPSPTLSSAGEIEQCR